MDFNQLQLNLQEINNIDSINMEAVIAEVYSDQENLQEINVTTLTVFELINLTKRAIYQLKDELENGLKSLLPEQYNYQNEYGNGTLNSLLISIRNSFEAKTVSGLQTLELQIKILVYYEIINGFYEKSARNYHSLRGLSVTDTENKLNMMIAHFDNNLEKKKTLFEQLDTKNNDLENLIIQKREELKQITLNLDTANTNSKNISNLLNQSTETKGKIDSMIDNINKLYDEADEKNIEINNTYKGQEQRIGEIISISEKNIKTSEDQLAEHKKYLEFFDKKEEEVNNISYLKSVDGLSHTFWNRKDELSKTINFWKISVSLVAALLLIFLIILFWEVPTNVDWTFFVLRSLKSLPVAVLLYFAIRQYNKERNFQEEYAFKSSCAITIKSFADIIKDENKKNELIMASVLGVYKSPIANEEKDDQPSRDILKMGINLSEGVKNFSKK